MLWLISNVTAYATVVKQDDEVERSSHHNSGFGRLEDHDISRGTACLSVEG